MSAVDVTAADRLCLTCGAKLPYCKPSRLKAGKGRYCSPKCFHANYPKRPLEERFWENVRKSEGCWLWQGTIRPDGYGTIGLGIGKKQQVVHRVSYTLHYGDIPDGLHVCHRCDNPPCVNPDHLFLGTAGDNQADKVAKGRQLKGESITNSKLTAEQVKEIRDRYASGGISQTALAREYGVAQGAVSFIIRGVNWKHIA